MEQPHSDSGSSSNSLRLPILELAGLEQRLHDAERAEEFTVHVHEAIQLYPGDFAALLGPSGCGKTTLLTVLGLLRAPTYPGRVERFVVRALGEGNTVTEINVSEAWRGGRYGQLEWLRRRHLGFALQSGELLPALTVRENLAVPLRLNGFSRRETRDRVDVLLDAFSLRSSAQCAESGRRAIDLSNARVNKLSGGEYQRVSLARAIAHRPGLVFVDEPTAALNRELARGAITQLCGALGPTTAGATVMITHDEQLAEEFANVTIRMAPHKSRPAGEVVEIVRRPGDCDSGTLALAQEEVV